MQPSQPGDLRLNSGGEEFAAILPGNATDAGLALGRNITGFIVDNYLRRD